MLKNILIRNYALIDELEIDLAKGLTIITGETGAGKSILLGALGLLMGDRADVTALYDPSKKCLVEGTFNLKDYDLKEFFLVHDLEYDVEIIIRREVNPEGKSRAFINDSPVTISVLKLISSRLIDVHAQHETLHLNEAAFQLHALDAVAETSELVAAYKLKFKLFKKNSEQLQSLKEQELKDKKELDYFNFQFNELDTAQLLPGQQAVLEAELETIENAEFIKGGLSNAYFVLAGADKSLIDALTEVKNTLAQLAKFNPSIATLNDRVQSSHIELKDIASELEALEGNIIHDPKKADIVQEKLDVIYRLQQKHNVKTIDELIILKTDLEQKITAIGSLEEQIKKLAMELEAVQKHLADLAGKLTKKRAAAAPQFSKSVKETLTQLGMANAELNISMEQLKEYKETGLDKVTFLFSANKGSDAQPLSKVASGGELSRFMLSLKSLLAKHTALPTIIFDEIDAGISGDIAAKTGSILEKMAATMQVITITHLPQVACKGKTHLFVYKQEQGKRTVTRIKQLNKEERVEEIAKMLSAGKVGEAALRNAKELLKG
ncbi:MAG: DNA repair protein RecN [Flavobacteriales bacterium]|nr:MAG: DNA repair protein RecN [Flavobacteriales bacterium]